VVGPLHEAIARELAGERIERLRAEAGAGRVRRARRLRAAAAPRPAGAGSRLLRAEGR